MRAQVGGDEVAGGCGKPKKCGGRRGRVTKKDALGSKVSGTPEGWTSGS